MFAKCYHQSCPCCLSIVVCRKDGDGIGIRFDFPQACEKWKSKNDIFCS